MSAQDFQNYKYSSLDELKKKYGTERVLAFSLDELLKRKQIKLFKESLYDFVKYFWDVLEPDTILKEGWALEALCLHLEACAEGRIKRLLINVPPGSMKSLLSSVFFPAWIWCNGKPGKRFISMSFSGDNPERDNRKTINLINSPKFQRLYSDVFRLTKAGEELLETNKTGFKQALGIRGGVTGKRCDFLIVDDPNNIAEAESEQIRNETNRKFQEAVSNRLNDLEQSCIICIQQRSHQEDVSGLILENNWPYVHLCLPLLYEPGRHCETYIGDELFWSDPRSEEGENFWPERFPPTAVEYAMDMGEFSFAGQMQQRPEPRGGGIIKREYWQEWSINSKTKKREFPQFDIIVASLDPAFTSKEENDPSGFTVWGCFLNENGERCVMLIYAFRKRLELHGIESPRQLNESEEAYHKRTSNIEMTDSWGLVETIEYYCRKFKVEYLLVENKASGLSIIQEMARLFPRSNFSVQAVDPKSLDKMARVIRVQPTFAGLYVYVPLHINGNLKDYAKLVVDECAAFPRGKYDDLVDSTTQAIWWLRASGYMERRAEQFVRKEDALRKYKEPSPLYNI